MTQTKTKAPRRRQALAKAATADVLVDAPKSRRRAKLSDKERELIAWPSLTADTNAIARAVSASTAPVAEEGQTVEPTNTATGAVSLTSEAPVSASVAHTVQPQTIGGELWLALVHTTTAGELITRALWRWASAKIGEWNAR